jgi:Mrp family chromosome partitioning ATPase
MRRRGPVITLTKHKYPSASPVPDEEMMGLLSAVRAALPQKRSCAVGIISTLPREGTTTIAQSLAQVAARNPRTKVIMCRVTHEMSEGVSTPFIYLEPISQSSQDYARSSQHALPPNARGDGNYPLAQTNGGSPMMGQLTAASDLSYIVKSLTGSFDLVVVDLPSASEGALGPSLAKGLDGVIVVVEAERTRLHAVRATRKSIEMYGGTILGFVLNKRKFHIPEALYRRL